MFKIKWFKKAHIWFNKQLVISIPEIAFAGIFVAMWIVSSRFLTIDFGLMRAGITYIWPLILGLTIRPILGLLSCIIADTISLAIGNTGIAQWIWAYAIIPIFIYTFAYLWRSIFISKNEKIWWIMQFLTMLVITVVSLVIVLLNKDFNNGKTANVEANISITSLVAKISIFIAMGLTLLIQIILMIIYYFNKNIKLKITLSMFSLISLIIITTIWIWGPIAQIIWLNRFGGNKQGYWDMYNIYLIARIIKTPIILPLYTFISLPIYSTTKILINDNDTAKW